MKKTFTNEQQNAITLGIITEHGQCAVSVDLSSLTRQERIFLFGLLQGAREGGSVGFGVEQGEDERTKIVKFTLTNPLAQTISTAVTEALNGSPS